MSNSPVTTTPEPAWAAFVALDWGSQKHAWILQPADGSKREQGFLDNTPEAVAIWAAELGRRFPGRPFAVALEQKRGSVVNLLLCHPHLVLFPVPASMSASYRKTFVPSGAKNDPGDAAWILDLLLRHRDRLRRLQPDDPKTRLLLMLVEDRRQLVDDKTRLALRLQDCLKQYFPQLVQWFDVDTALVADLLKHWPELQHLQRCHDGTLRMFFRRHHAGEELTTSRIEAIRAAVPATDDPALLEAGSMKARHLTESIATLRDQITRLELRRDELVADHPDSAIFASFPGAGRATPPCPASSPPLEHAANATSPPSRWSATPASLPSTSPAATPTASACGTPARSSLDRHSTSLPDRRSHVANGPRLTTRRTATSPNSTMPPFGLWLSSGFAFCSAAGRTANPTTSSSI